MHPRDINYNAPKRHKLQCTQEIRTTKTKMHPRDIKTTTIIDQRDISYNALERYKRCPSLPTYDLTNAAPW